MTIAQALMVAARYHQHRAYLDIQVNFFVELLVVLNCIFAVP